MEFSWEQAFYWEPSALRPVRKAAVATVAQGLKVKEEAESIVDEAKAELDDILAEAGYDKGAEETEEEAAKELAEAQEAEGK